MLDTVPPTLRGTGIVVEESNEIDDQIHTSGGGEPFLKVTAVLEQPMDASAEIRPDMLTRQCRGCQQVRMQEDFSPGQWEMVETSTCKLCGYVCFRCQVPGHHVRDCPTKGDPAYDRTTNPKTKPMGIPASHRVKVANEHVHGAMQGGDGNFYVTKTSLVGEAVLRNNAQAASASTDTSASPLSAPSLHRTVVNVGVRCRHSFARVGKNRLSSRHDGGARVLPVATRKHLHYIS
jgi:hypothetical protein